MQFAKLFFVSTIVTLFSKSICKEDIADKLIKRFNEIDYLQLNEQNNTINENIIFQFFKFLLKKRSLLFYSATLNNLIFKLNTTSKN